jgi:hypothetical protein
VAAAIGGYCRLRAARFEELHNWTKNLDESFDWLPDGAVIHAWHRLQGESPDLRSARARLLEAERRGLPLFTSGLRLLFDGLSAFNRQDTADRDTEQALLRLRPYAAAADRRAPTTFTGKSPTEPL